LLYLSVPKYVHFELQMKEVLGVTPRDLKDTIVDMAYSLIDAGLVKKSKKFKVCLTNDL